MKKKLIAAAAAVLALATTRGRIREHIKKEPA